MNIYVQKQKRKSLGSISEQRGSRREIEGNIEKQVLEKTEEKHKKTKILRAKAT